MFKTLLDRIARLLDRSEEAAAALPDHRH